MMGAGGGGSGLVRYPTITPPPVVLMMSADIMIMHVAVIRWWRISCVRIACLVVMPSANTASV